jgi:hypothetical protein
MATHKRQADEHDEAPTPKRQKTMPVEETPIQRAADVIVNKVLSCLLLKDVLSYFSVCKSESARRQHPPPDSKLDPSDLEAKLSRPFALHLPTPAVSSPRFLTARSLKWLVSTTAPQDQVKLREELCSRRFIRMLSPNPQRSQVLELLLFPYMVTFTYGRGDMRIEEELRHFSQILYREWACPVSLRFFLRAFPYYLRADDMADVLTIPRTGVAMFETMKDVYYSESTSDSAFTGNCF